MNTPVLRSARSLPTPPLSPRKRRRILRESEDSSGGMTIEQYLYRTDPYRSTTAAIAFPLPVMRSNVSFNAADSRRLKDLEPTIQTVLIPAIKDPFTFRFCELSKPGYPGGDIKVATLLVDVHEGKVQPSSWFATRDVLRSILQKTGYPAVEVEIVDLSRSFMPSIFPQSSMAGSVKVYERFRDTVTKILFRQLGELWNCMSLFKMGRSRAVSAPSIIIYVKPYTWHDWQTLELTIKALFSNEIPQGEDLGVEFLPGVLSDVSGKVLSEDSFSSPRMGSSIGLRESKSSGTMGGFMNLKVGSHIHYGALTNHHVIEPPLPSIEDSLNEAARGYQYGSETTSRTPVQCPSAEDLEATRKGIFIAIQQFTEQAEELKAKQEERELMGVSPYLQLEASRKNYLAIVKAKQEELATVNRLPIILGCTLVSSGHAVNSESAIVDWAFIEFSPSLQQSSDLQLPMVNVLPPANHPQLKSESYEGAAFYAGSLSKTSPFLATNFGEIKKNGWYFKQGRTSNVTAGICNGTEAEINRSGQGIRYDEEGKAYTLREKSTRELIILSYDKDHQESEIQVPFSKPGDSGSFVINELGMVCGLLYGEHTGLCGNRYDHGAGLVMSMTDVCSSVALKTTVQDDIGNRVSGELMLPAPV